MSSGRPTILHVRLSPEEIARLDSLRRGLSRSAYIRSLLPEPETEEKPWSDFTQAEVLVETPEPVQARPARAPRRITAARPPAAPSRQECRHPGRMRFGSIGNRTCRVCGTKGLP